MGRGRTDLRRKRGNRVERPRFLIVTEGEATEPEYFKRLLLHLRATGSVLVDVRGLGKDPYSVVMAAAEWSGLKSSSRQSREYDAVWCVVDVDEHASLPRALEEANRLGIKLAITNPCFELWLAWHYRDLRQWVSARDVQQACRVIGIQDKHLPINFPISDFFEAVERAHQAGDGCAFDSIPENPGSSVCELVVGLSKSA